MVKNLPANAKDARDVGLSPGSGRSPGGGNGDPLQYSCLGYPMARGAWQPMVHGVTKSGTRLSDQHKTCCMYFSTHTRTRSRWMTSMSDGPGATPGSG